MNGFHSNLICRLLSTNSRSGSMMSEIRAYLSGFLARDWSNLVNTLQTLFMNGFLSNMICRLISTSSRSSSTMSEIRAINQVYWHAIGRTSYNSVAFIYEQISFKLDMQASINKFQVKFDDERNLCILVRLPGKQLVNLFTTLQPLFINGFHSVLTCRLLSSSLG